MKKTIFVSGGSKRIGKSICEYFHKNDFNIICHFNNSEKEAENLKADAQKTLSELKKREAEVENEIKGGSIPKEFIPGVEKGVESVADNGILAGFPLIDYKVTILDGLHHDVDSSVLAFELASRQCFKEACTKATLKLLFKLEWGLLDSLEKCS